MVRTLTIQDDLSRLTDVITTWVSEAKLNEFKIETDLGECYKDIIKLRDNENSDLFIMEEDEKIVGIMGVTIIKSPLSKQLIANEHYLYILPEYRGRSRTLIKAFKEWAYKNGCSHMIMNASYLASDLTERVSKLYEYMGYKKFESVYIGEV